MVQTEGVLALRRTPESPESSYLMHHVRVSAVRPLSPSFVRVTFSGPDLDRVADTGFDQRFKLILPLGEWGLDLVGMDDDWYSVWREQPDDRRNPVRTYTVRAVRQDACELDVDVVRHGPTGPAGAWIDGVRVGDEAMLCAPNRDFDGDPGGVDFVPPVAYDRLLLAGDETAVPAISSIIDRLPAGTRATVVVEVPLTGDSAALPQRAGVDLRVVARDGGPRGTPLIAAVREAADALLAEVELPEVELEQRLDQPLEDVDVDTETLWEVPRDGDGPAQLRAPLYAWLAGEAAVIKTLRRYLVTERGLDRRCVAFMGYWREGVVEDNR